ncbi:MAG: InlB B-repeat-containing protein, partial [Dolichospermum sp.]
MTNSLLKKLKMHNLVLLLLFFTTTFVAQTTRNVSNSSELTSAISNSANGDIINLTTNIVISDQVIISGKTITIEGNGFEVSVPRPGLDDMGRFNSSPSNFRVFLLSSAANVTINNLKIKGGTLTSGIQTTGSGGGVLVSSGTTLRLENCVISNSRSNVGTSFVGGGALAVFGVAYVNNSLIIRNAANYAGAFVCQGTNARLYVNNSTFSENRSTLSQGGGGAGEVNGSAICYINNSTFSNNQASADGGALQAGGGGTFGTIYVLNSTFSGNIMYGTGWSSNAGAIAAAEGIAYVVNSLFAYNYYRTGGTVSNPTSFALLDFAGGESNASRGVKLYHSIYHSTIHSSFNITGNIQYTGNLTGSDNSIFSGGILSKITDGTGAEIGTAMVFRAFLFNDGNSVAPTLRTGSFLLDAARRGVKTRYNQNNASPVASYNSSGSTFTALPGSNVGTLSDLVLTDQLGEARGDQPLRGAIDNSTAGIIDDLYIVKVNGASGGTVNGGTIYGDSYRAGSSVTLTAIANSGQQFVRWDYVSGGSGTA